LARVALVTGGTRGIGEAICRALQARGYRVAATFHENVAAAEKFHASTGIPIFRWDVSCSDECKKGIKRISDTLGRIEILVNNAGITRDVAFRKMTDDEWHIVMKKNLNSAFYMTRGVIDGMRHAGFGRIINISSINGQRGRYGQVNYSTAKAALLGMTKALAMEYARRGITVNAVAPGHIDTDIVRSGSDELIQSLIAENPVGRLGLPEEIARCVTFLASDEAGFCNGTTISVNGGALMV
jgi:acetoacetyl-CoA reductase